jgi:hypothetical protein
LFDSCLKVKEWMSGFDGKWGIAGGWAIDLFAGKESRDHSDIEIAIFREDQLALKNALPDWSFEKVVNGEFFPWMDEFLELPVHEIHSVHKQNGEKLEVLFNETRDEKWIFRREPSISFPESSLFLYSNEGIPYLHPAVVLLYKAKKFREKDYADFLTVKDLLKEEDKHWLRETLHAHIPEHPWTCEL